MRPYRRLYSQTAREQIKNLHPDIKSVVRSRLDRLKRDPYGGKCLERELSGYRSLSARRFRIIYKVDDESGILEIHYVGHRRDIYESFAERTASP